MDRCQTCQAQMLEFLYDLLDEAECQEFQAHLKECAGCQAALRQGQDQQQLFATAAKLEFIGVQFAAPQEAETPRVLELPRPAPARSWKRWAAAAAILLTLAGIAGAGAWIHGEAQDAELAVAHAQA